MANLRELLRNPASTEALSVFREEDWGKQPEVYIAISRVDILLDVAKRGMADDQCSLCDNVWFRSAWLP